MVPIQIVIIRATKTHTALTVVGSSDTFKYRSALFKTVSFVIGGVLKELRKAGDVVPAKYLKLFVTYHNHILVVHWTVRANCLRYKRSGRCCYCVDRLCLT